MTIEPGTLIQKIEEHFSDRRTNLAEVSLEESAGGWVVSGRVLDARTHSLVLAELAAGLPGEELIDGLRELRTAYPAWMNVVVNITGLYARPDWIAEMLSQNTYGALVEILETQGDWVFVRQLDGYLGWMFKDYLSAVAIGAASHRVSVPMMLLHSDPDLSSLVVFRLPEAAEVIASERLGGMMKIEPHPGNLPSGMPGGWAAEADLQEPHNFPASTRDKREIILRTAYGLVGVPYLWGGTTSNGIDCSGLAQLSYHMAGLTLPRDADMQRNAGKPLDGPPTAGDLLYFSSEEDHSRVIHVAISLGGSQIIHSSRRRNGVAVDDIQQVPHLRSTYLNACTYFDLDQ